MRFQFLIFLCLTQLIHFSAYATPNFFEQRYRGWIWFEEREILKEQLDQDKSKQPEPKEEEYAKAREEVEHFAAELEKFRYMMIRYPGNLEHIKRYKEKEAVLLQNALTLSSNYTMVNFLQPELADELESPANLYGRTIKKQVQQDNQQKALELVAKKVELFLFFSQSCPYCGTLEKHLSSFAIKYGFKVTAISPDGSKSKYFQSHTSPELIKQLELEVMPTVIAVTNDSSIRFELARGAVSIPDLEEKALLLSMRMQQLEADYKQEEGMEWQLSKE